MALWQLLPGQLTRAITFQLIAPGTIHPGQLFPQAIAPRTIILPPGQLPPIPIAPRILPWSPSGSWSITPYVISIDLMSEINQKFIRLLLLFSE